MKKSSFKDVDSLYKIIDINNECIISKDNNIYYKTYIYEIESIILLDLSDDIVENIINQYNEFLRQLNNDLKILVINKEYNIKEYFMNTINNELINKDMYKDYMNDMEEILNREKIFDTFFYIIISIKNDNVENVENSFEILERIGCKVKKIKGKEEIINILNKSINKEW